MHSTMFNQLKNRRGGGATVMTTNNRLLDLSQQQKHSSRNTTSSEMLPSLANTSKLPAGARLNHNLASASNHTPNAQLLIHD